MVEGGQVQLFLAMKVIIDHRHVDVGRLADPAHGRELVALIGKQLDGRLQDARARRFAFSFVSLVLPHAIPIV
ncbi:hypothetical protein D3C72_1915270 [compost metagenome]